MTHVLTLISKPGTVLTDEPFVISLAAQYRHQWLEPNTVCDFFVDGPQSIGMHISTKPIDMILQPLAHREKRLLISDMDSTMIVQECIDELADFAGVKDYVARITERAMNGELDFKTALRERVLLLKDLPERVLDTVFESRISLMPGAKTLVATMAARGAHCVLVSGGFTFFTARVAAALGFHAHEANTLNIAGGKLTGTVHEPILDKESKREALHRIAQQHHVPLAATLAIGDGANDLPMLQDAGLGIAFHAKPMVVEQASAAIHHNDLTAALYAQGIPRKDWVS